MKIETLDHFLRAVVAPMFPGSEPEKSQFTPKRPRTEMVVYDRAPTKLRVRQNPQAAEFFTLTRLQKWDGSEMRLIETLLRVYDDAKSKASTLLNQLEDFIVRRAVARTVASNQQADTVEMILETFSGWSSQTYEGARVSSGIVVRPEMQQGTAYCHFWISSRRTLVRF